MVYRRFGELFARLLLHKQDELTELEEKLLEMDMFDSSEGQDNRRLMSRKLDNALPVKKDYGQTRQELLEKVERKALGYCWLSRQDSGSLID